MSVLGRLFRYLLGIVVVLVVLAAGIGIYALTELNRPAGDAGSPQQVFSIEPGEGVPAIATRLERQQLINSSFLFRIMLRLTGSEEEIKAGDFQLSAAMTPREIIDAISTSPTESGARVTIPEGYRVEQIADLLEERGMIDRARFLDLVVTAAFEYDWLPSGRTAVSDLEGYLFPDTYNFPRHGTDREERILGEMLANFDRRVTPEMRAQIAAGSYSLHDVLTIASIVEREARVAEERPTIAGVFYNRLARDIKLDADPTTQYALGKPGDWWPELRLDPNTVDHPYNTYVYKGMPPGPIANPGLDSIRASISPASHEMIFFVACGGGRHVFAATLEEHERNIARCQ